MVRTLIETRWSTSLASGSDASMQRVTDRFNEPLATEGTDGERQSGQLLVEGVYYQSRISRMTRVEPGPMPAIRGNVPSGAIRSVTARRVRRSPQPRAY